MGAFASHVLLKIKTKNSKGFWNFEVKSSPGDLIMKKKVSVRVMILVYSNKMKSIKGTRRR